MYVCMYTEGRRLAGARRGGDQFARKKKQSYKNRPGNTQRKARSSGGRQSPHIPAQMSKPQLTTLVLLLAVLASDAFAPPPALIGAHALRRTTHIGATGLEMKRASQNEMTHTSPATATADPRITRARFVQLFAGASAVLAAGTGPAAAQPVAGMKKKTKAPGMKGAAVPDTPLSRWSDACTERHKVSLTIACKQSDKREGNAKGCNPEGVHQDLRPRSGYRMR